MAKILLVEDDNNLREIYEARLQAEGYEIVSARDGEEALVVAKSEKPDLIISDVMMPKISGFEMLDILRNTEGLKHVKVVMLTALGQSDDQQRANKLGADRYLVKSQVTLEDIVKAAQDLLSDAGAAPATETPPPTAPAAPTTPAGNPPAATDDNTAKDDKVMDDAVTSLVADTEKEQAAEAPSDDIQQAPTVTRKVIKPIERHEKDIQTLLAEEEAKESGATLRPSVADMPAAPSTASEEASVDAKIENFVAGASTDPTPPSEPTAPAPAPAPTPEPTPSPSPASPPPQTPSAAAQPPQPPADKPEDKPSPDPNIIAL